VRRKNSYKRRRAMFNWSKDWNRWSEDERIALFWLEISAIKNLIYETPFKGATTVYKQETVDAYWDELMTRMPEGREPEYKAN